MNEKLKNIIFVTEDCHDPMVKQWGVNSKKRTEVTLQYKRYKKRHTRKTIYLLTHPKLGGKIYDSRVFDDGSCMVAVRLSYTLDTKDKFEHDSQLYLIIIPCIDLHILLKLLKKPKTVKALRKLMKKYLITPH